MSELRKKFIAQLKLKGFKAHSLDTVKSPLDSLPL